ncbi:APC family permease [Telluribacter humicola]|uniref:APC family permease n=1 Tax=Telluribacter humicola TaxID=1720261 RepID=UPI001A96CE8B|nr:amino acid permease [Telluribacter humicola]
MKEDHSEFNRSLGLFDSTLIVSGSMIGSGIFIVTADMSRNLGSSGWLLFTWILTGIITIAAALSYGELAGMMPKAGGQFVYIQRAYNSLLGFVYGWTVFTVIQTGTIAAVAVAFTKFTAVFIPALNPENVILNLGPLSINTSSVFAMGSIILLTYINSLGVEMGKWIQNIFTSTKLLALVALIVIGISLGNSTGMLEHNFSNAWQAFSINPDGTIIPLSGLALLMAIGVSMIGSLFSADAWNNVTFIAGEIKNPKKNIPLSLFLGTLIVTCIYILCNIAYLSLLPLLGMPTAQDVLGRGISFAAYDRVGTAAAEVFFGDMSVSSMAILIMISTFGCNNGLILSGARLYYAMAREGLFIKQAGELNKQAVPAKALWMQCLWACLLCLSGSYGELLNYCTFGSLLFYIITIIGIFILRKKEPMTERPYRAFGYPLVPAFYIIVTSGICLILLLDPKTRFDTGMGLLIAGLGVPIYFLTRKRT